MNDTDEEETFEEGPIRELTAKRDKLLEELEAITKAVEAAFREGYGQGYDQGSSDQCSYEWGCGGGSAQSRKVTEDQEWRDSDARKALHPCPKCGSRNVGDHHHNGNALAPECHYWACYDCNHQWDHQ